LRGKAEESAGGGLIRLERAPPRTAVRAVLAFRSALERAAEALAPGEIVAWETAIAFFRTRTAVALVDTGVIDALTDRPRDAADLAAELDLHADTLHRALRLAAAQRLVRIDRRGRFRLTRVGRAYSSSASPTLAPWLRYLNTEPVQRTWAALARSLRDGEPTFPAVYGRSIWQHLAENPDEERLFAQAMREMSALVMPWIVGGYPWPEQGLVADVAGGSGPVLAGVLAARPRLRGVLIDAPGVLREADGHLRRAGVRERVELVEGDIFAGIEAAADVYVLKDILHDWDDERSAEILATVAAAMPAGSRLVLIETLLDRNEPDPIAAAVDLHMLTQCDGGRQRSARELQELLRGAGLRPGKVHLTGGPSLIEGLK
jgi:hypothetical protein